MKTWLGMIVVLLMLLPSWAGTTIAFAEKPARTALFYEIRNAISGLQWSSETDYEWKPLFIVADPKCERAEQLLEGWAGLFPGKGRPECTACVDEWEGGFETFIRQRLDYEPEEDEDDASREERLEQSARWQTLSDLMERNLTRLNAYEIGGDEAVMSIIVLCGFDPAGNLVGCWVRSVQT